MQNRVPETSQFDVRRLTETMAAEVVGLDLRQPFDAATRDAVYKAFVDNQILVFRDQDLTKDEQVAFTEQFGTLERHALTNRGTSDSPFVHIVTNMDADGNLTGKLGSTRWHSDKSFRPAPSMATILHARILPPDGGDTVFANMHAAYEALDEAEKAELDDAKVIHSWELSRENIGRKLSQAEIDDARRRRPILWPVSIRIRGAGPCSWACMPRISKAAASRKAEPASRLWKRMPPKTVSPIVTTGGRETC